MLVIYLGLNHNILLCLCRDIFWIVVGFDSAALYLAMDEKEIKPGGRERWFNINTHVQKGHIKKPRQIIIMLL